MSAPIVIKRKAGHAGHHGGAWKVAYADFVTAMMALFIVLWLMNSSKQIQVAVGGYFKDPTGSSKMVGSNMHGSGENFSLTKDNMPLLREQLQQAIRKIENFEKLSKQVEMTITAEGLRIELMESKEGTFFEVGKSKPNVSGQQLLSALAAEIGRLPNRVYIEGHTDAKPYDSPTYTNWELSVDRANEARRLMQQNGLGATQVLQVRGYADQRLRKANDPEDPSNRRISVIVRYQEVAEPAPTGAPSAQAAEAHH